MSSGETPVNIARLLTTFNIEIRALPDKLKCAQCKSVLKDACQVPCGCRFCRTCIDGLIEKGGQFCPGGLEECGVTSLLTVQRDFRANKSIKKLTAKCPHVGCTHECPLADMEGHLRVCSGKNMICPFSKLGCLHGGLAAADMSSHMQQESGSHSEILIGLVADIKRDMEVLKQDIVMKDEHVRHMENDIKSIKGENESIVAKLQKEMEMLKEDQAIHWENEIKSVKDENKSIREENESMKNEIRSIKIENESIKREKEVLSERVRQLSENLEWERDERRQSDERASAGISAVASNRDALSTEMESVRGDIRSIKEQLDSLRCQVGSMQVAVGLMQLADWLIDEDVGKTGWGNAKTSNEFSEGRSPYEFELAALNFVNKGELWIWLRIWAGPGDAQLQWPFRGAVTFTVAHRDNAKKCMRQTQQCQIKRPADNQCRSSERIIFKHAALMGAGLVLERGVRVSCQIVPGAGQ